MGKLTDDLTRLRGEIEILRGREGADARPGPGIILTGGTMISDFAADHIRGHKGQGGT